MSRSTSRACLDRLLADEKLDDKELEELIAGDEDLFLEFKETDLGDDKGRKATRKKMREAVCGFANSEGGILLLGVSEKPKPHIVGVKNSTGLKLDEWAGTALSPLYPQFSTMPRIHVHKHKNGDVLVIAVNRAHDVMRLPEDHGLGIYLRFQKSTERAPDYLVTDLLLGRRAHPVLSLESTGAPISVSGGSRSVSFHFRVENVGLVPANNVIIGMVSWHSRFDEPRLNRFLAASVDIQEPKGTSNLGDFKTAHRTGVPSNTGSNDIPPFAVKDFARVGPFILPVSTSERMNALVCAAVYVMPVGDPPLWFQMKYTLSNVSHTGRDAFEVSEIDIVRVFDNRPIVSIEYKIPWRKCLPLNGENNNN